MTSGIKARDLIVGTGEEATRDKQVKIHVRGFLNRGELVIDTHSEGQPWSIEIGQRDCIAGLRYGVEGMKVGGKRELVISPHLAYGTDGLPGRVPPNAVIRFEVELLEVHDAGVRKSEDYPPGKHLFVFSPGEAATMRPRWQFGLQEDGRCGVMLTIPVVGCTWRHARLKNIEEKTGMGEAAELLEEISEMPHRYPNECLTNDDLWSDQSEKANGITRDSKTGTRCVTMGVQERGQWICYYSLRETSDAFVRSKIRAFIAKILAPEFAV